MQGLMREWTRGITSGSEVLAGEGKLGGHSMSDISDDCWWRSSRKGLMGLVEKWRCIVCGWIG